MGHRKLISGTDFLELKLEKWVDSEQVLTLCFKGRVCGRFQAQVGNKNLLIKKTKGTHHADIVIHYLLNHSF